MSESAEKIGDQIRARREARGWSQAELGRRAGTNQQNVDRIEKGQVQNSRYLQAIVSVLNFDVGKAVQFNAESGELIEKDILVGSKGMPLYSATEGGAGATIVNFEPIDYLKWPAPLLHVPDGFGVLVVEESMFPVFEPGDIALVNPRITPRKGKNCVLLGPDTGRPQVKSLIKRFVSQGDSTWRVEQWNPQETFELAKADWPRCFSVVGKYDAR